MNPKTMMRFRPFLSGPIKLSKDPVPSAKAASTHPQTNRATTKALRHPITADDCLEGSLCFITQHNYNELLLLAIQKYVYFVCFIYRPVSMTRNYLADT